MEQVQLEFTIDPDHPKDLEEPWVGLGDFVAQHNGAVVYNRDALASLWVDLISGRPLPTRLILRELRSIDQIFCLALFMDRELALNPKVPGLISSVSLARNMQEAGLAHIDPDLTRLLIFLDIYLFREKGKKALARKLEQALTWIREYALEGKLPNLPRPSDPPKVLDKGTNGFVVAECGNGAFFESVVDLYRQGYLRGVLFGPESPKGSVALAFRKTHYLNFDLESASVTLNQAEEKVGRPVGWEVEGNFLKNSETLMPRDIIVEVLLRV